MHFLFWQCHFVKHTYMVNSEYEQFLVNIQNRRETCYQKAFKILIFCILKLRIVPNIRTAATQERSQILRHR